MQRTYITMPSRIIVIACIALFSSACSGPNEDVRVSFCKELTVEMLGKPEALEWTASDAKAERLGDLVIKLDYVVSNTDGKPTKGKVICTYAEDDTGEYSMGSVDSWESYETLPYRVSLNDRLLSDQKLNASTQAAMLSKAKQFADTIQLQTRKVADEVSEGVKGISNEINKALNP